MNLVIGCDSLIIAQSQAICCETDGGETPFSQVQQSTGMEDCSHQYAIVYHGSLPVGCACIAVHGNGAVLTRLVVVPEFRNSGRAKALIKSLVRYAQKRRLASLTVFSPHYFSRFFLALGFELTGDRCQVDNHSIRELRLKLDDSMKREAA